MDSLGAVYFNTQNGTESKMISFDFVLPPNASQTNVMESPVRYGPTNVVLRVPVSSNITTGSGGTENKTSFLIVPMIVSKNRLNNP